MYDIFIKPLNSCDSMSIFLGCFYDLNKIINIIDYCINSSEDDPIYKRSILKRYPVDFFEVLVKDSSTDEEILVKVFDVKNKKFVEEAQNNDN